MFEKLSKHTLRKQQEVKIWKFNSLSVLKQQQSSHYYCVAGNNDLLITSENSCKSHFDFIGCIVSLFAIRSINKTIFLQINELHMLTPINRLPPISVCCISTVSLNCLVLLYSTCIVFANTCLKSIAFLSMADTH